MQVSGFMMASTAWFVLHRYHKDDHKELEVGQEQAWTTRTPLPQGWQTLSASIFASKAGVWTGDEVRANDGVRAGHGGRRWRLAVEAGDGGWQQAPAMVTGWRFRAGAGRRAGKGRWNYVRIWKKSLLISEIKNVVMLEKKPLDITFSFSFFVSVRSSDGQTSDDIGSWLPVPQRSSFLTKKGLISLIWGHRIQLWHFFLEIRPLKATKRPKKSLLHYLKVNYYHFLGEINMKM